MGARIIAGLIEEGDEIRSFDIKTDDSIARSILEPLADTIEWRTGDIA